MPFMEKKVDAAEESLRRSYQRTSQHSRVIVDFPCVPIAQLTGIELEYGVQSSQLTLLRFSQRPEGGFDVLGVEVRALEQQTAARFEVKTANLNLGPRALDPGDVSTPLMATINEVVFDEGGVHVRGFGGGPEIHRLLRLDGISVNRAHFERRYTGEAESSAQTKYLPLDLASKPLLAAVPAAVFGATFTDAHRQLLLARFSASFVGAPAWLRELFLVLASRLGSPPMIPTLLHVAQEGPEPERVLASDALASITGWDVRFNGDGTRRAVSEVAADYARECTRTNQ